jgi:hypothetical protein
MAHPMYIHTYIYSFSYNWPWLYYIENGTDFCWIDHCWLLNTKQLKSVCPIKSGFEKIDTSHLGPKFSGRYPPWRYQLCILLREMVSIRYWHLIRTVWALFLENHFFVFVGPMWTASIFGAGMFRFTRHRPKMNALKYWMGPVIAQAVSRRLPTAAARGSSPGQVMWDLWWTKWHWCRCQFAFQRLHHTHHLSSGAGTIAQTVAAVPSGLSLTPWEK